MLYLIIAFVIINNVNAAEDCQAKRTLVIACTMKCRDTYKKALKEAADELGYRVNVVTLMDNPSAAYDGLLSPGGGDIHYSLYTDPSFNDRLPDVSKLKESIKKNYEKFSPVRSASGLKRDHFEIDLWRRYFSDKKFAKTPALGICYGMQMLGVSSGLPMYVDIENSLGISARRKIIEKVDILGSAEALSEISMPFFGYYNHHQALHYKFYKENKKYYQEDFDIIASSHNDTIPEMLKFKKRLAFGTQFHPERLTGDYRKNAISIFKWFLTKACLKQN